MFVRKKQPPVITDPARIDAILNRGVITTILPSKKEFRSALLSGKPLRMYIGVDPTGSRLHLSHAKNFMLLEEFRKLGHKVFLLFGTFTALIGDPTDRASARARLTREEIEKNVAEWKRQIAPIVEFGTSVNPPEVVFNHSWLEKLSFEDVINLASHFTVQHMLERDMFEKRMRNGDPVFLHEFLYPLMQGYDSVALEVDAEFGGTDQTFNMLAGRALLRKMKDKEKFVVAVNLMENPKTGALMSKTDGTGVFLDASANDMYGAIMAQPDEMTEIFLVNNTRVPLEKIEEMKKLPNPKDAKMFAAREVAKVFYGEAAAQEAEKVFNDTFSKKETPVDIPLVSVAPKTTVVQASVLGGIPSLSEARRLVDQGGVRDAETGEKITDPKAVFTQPTTLKLGKRRFVKIVPK